MQLRELSQTTSSQGTGIYLDLPVGVHPDGYDVWRRPELFAEGVCNGAPPDLLFKGGQNWGFPPMIPSAMLKNRFEYFIQSIRKLMEVCSILRLDHVMGLHRIYWIPVGISAREGTYVEYPARALYAILSLESHRTKTVIYGEDLGTVPERVGETMDRHRFGRMFVVQLFVRDDEKKPFPEIMANSLVSLNTHDTPTFSGYWHGRDIDDQVVLGLIDPQEEAEARRYRAGICRNLSRFFEASETASRDDPLFSILHASLKYLCQSRAGLVLINLEDLWLEENPQNVPGTSVERPSWRRPARYRLESLKQLPEVVHVLGQVNLWLGNRTNK
jgi:4-alpha-glucanotransferase